MKDTTPRKIDDLFLLYDPPNSASSPTLSFSLSEQGQTLERQLRMMHGQRLDIALERSAKSATQMFERLEQSKQFTQELAPGYGLPTGEHVWQWLRFHLEVLSRINGEGQQRKPRASRYQRMMRETPY